MVRWGAHSNFFIYLFSKSFITTKKFTDACRSNYWCRCAHFTNGNNPVSRKNVFLITYKNIFAHFVLVFTWLFFIFWNDSFYKSKERKGGRTRSEEHTSELQSRGHLVCRLLLEKKKKNTQRSTD